MTFYALLQPGAGLPKTNLTSSKGIDETVKISFLEKQRMQRLVMIPRDSHDNLLCSPPSVSGSFQSTTNKHLQGLLLLPTASPKICKLHCKLGPPIQVVIVRKNKDLHD